MKYEALDNDITTETSETYSYSTPSSYSTPRLNPYLVPKGLSRLAYNIMTRATRHNGYDLIIKDMTEEEVFNISKEISDFNLGVIKFPTLSYLGGITIYPIEDVEDYMREVRLLKYSVQYETSELCEDISNMSKDGYKLSHFLYIPDSDCYAAQFRKYNE